MSQDLSKYKDIHAKLIKDFKTFRQEKDSTIYAMELQIGELRDKLSTNARFLKEFNSLRENFQEKNSDLEKEVRLLREEAGSSRERLKMFSEDMIRYVFYKEMYEKSLDQLNTMRYKYNQLELNIAAGSVSLNRDGII